MKRLAGYVPDPILEYLEAWALRENRSLSSLVSFLLETAVRERQKEAKEFTPDYESLKELIEDNLTVLVASAKFPNGRLREMMEGDRPNETEILRLALLCNLTEEYLLELIER